MGTSTSSRGPSGTSPLVPPWADKDGLGPGPAPEPQRFQGFRTSLGRFVSSGDGAQLRAAIGRYARTATGGRAVGPRRFGSMAQTGGALFDAMSAFRDGNDAAGLDLAALNGRDTDAVIDAIVHALVPPDGDADRVRVAMNEALSECLEGYEEFDFSSITDEMLVSMMLAYVRNCVFGQIVLDSNEAFSKGSPARIEMAEKELRALVDAAVDKHMRPILSGKVRSFTGKQLEQVQLDATREIWAEWEAYEP